MISAFSIVPDLRHGFGLVAGIFPDKDGQTAVVCIVGRDQCHEDFRALSCETLPLRCGDSVAFIVLNALDCEQADDDEAHFCISMLARTNDLMSSPEMHGLRL